MSAEEKNWRIRPCAQLILWPMGFWLLYMVFVIQLDVLWWIRLLLMPLPLPWLLSFWERHCSLLHPMAIRQLRWHEGKWHATLAAGESVEVVIKRSPWVADWLLVVTFQDDRKRQMNLAVIPLQVGANAYRRLCRLLLSQAPS